MLVGVALVFGLAAPGAVSAQTLLDRIVGRGTLVVGVKADYEPFGFRDPKGALVGIEPDMARMIVERLSRETGRPLGLELVPVTAADRVDKLGAGAVDLVIATMGDNTDRRARVDFIEPHYYASGVNILTGPVDGGADWYGLAGRTVCVKQGHYFNKTLARRYRARVLAYKTRREALLALDDGHCMGYLDDDSALETLLKRPTWAAYRLPFPTVDQIPWAMAVAKGDGDGAFAGMVSRLVGEWHRDGTLVALVGETWGVERPSPFIQTMHDVWSRRQGGAEQYLCAFDAAGQLPDICR